MNLFLFELKTQFRTSVVWTFSLLIVLLLFMLGIFPVFEASLEDVLRVISGFPPAFAFAFGFDITTMFSLGGFYSFAFGYISLIGAIMAVSMGISAFSRESRSKCVDFLLTKPMSREKIFINKLLSNVVIIICVNIIYTIACIAIFAGDNTDKTIVLLASAALFFTQFVFLSLGILFAVLAKKVRSVTGISTAFGFGAFILSALVNIMNEDFIRWIAPLKYFDPTALFSHGAFESQYALIGSGIVIIALSSSFVWFCKRDTHTV